MNQLRQIGKTHAQIHAVGGPTFSWPECPICPPPWLDFVNRDLGQWLAVYTQRPDPHAEGVAATLARIERENLAWSTR